MLLYCFWDVRGRFLKKKTLRASVFFSLFSVSSPVLWLVNWLFICTTNFMLDLGCVFVGIHFVHKFFDFFRQLLV